MKLHLPGVLRNALLALMSSVTVFSANAYDTLVCEDRNFIAEEYTLSIHHQGNLIFRNNESYKIISMIEGCHVDFASSIVISGNTCRPSNPTGYTKGAIVDHSFYLNDCNSVQITDNTVMFDSLGDSGGIVAAISQFTDVDILFENNKVGSNAQMVGGVFLPEYSITSYMGEKEEVFSFFTDSELVFRNNHVKALLSENISGLPCYYAIIGGVMHAEKLKVTNSTILIENNTVDSGDASLLGGCVFGEFLAQDDKSVIEFRNNTVKGGTISGGIFYAAPSPYEYEHALEGFAGVTFENNKAISESDVVYGGAMSNQSDFMLIQNNGELRFIGNSAQSKDLKDVFGGALFCFSNGDSSIIWKNDYVLFRGNYVTDGKTYRLNSISSLSAAVILAADEGKRIEIFDPITMSNSLYIGYDITDKYDFTSCTGTILLSGIHAQEDLAKINPNYSEEDLLYSRVNEVYSLIAEYGNVILEDTVVLCTRPSPSYVTAYGGPNAYFTMRNSTLAAYRQTFYNLTMEGANILEAQYGTQIVHLTLNVTDVNKDTAVVSTEGKGIIFAQDDASGLYPVLNITYDKAKLLKGVYKLITLSPESDVYNIGSVTINGTKSTSIAYEGAGDDLYLLNEGNDIYTLVFDYSYGPGEVEQRDAATLTWNAASGTWGAGSGSANSCWSGNVEDLNYYNGDSVVFASAATVQLSGSLAPASVAVRNTSGKVEWSGTGQLAGATAVTKTGAGTLSINTANAYTGGTSVQGGTLVVGNAQALGSGDIALQGGTLNLGGYAVNNNVTVTNNATLSGASRYTGTLDLQSGRLSVEGALGTTVLVSGGSIAGDLELSGGSLTFDENDLNVGGELSITGAVTILLNGDYTAGQSYTLITTGDGIVGNLDLLEGELAGGNSRYQVTFSKDANNLTFTLSAEAMWLTWANAKKAVWQAGAAGWVEGSVFQNGDNVIFTDGTVSIVGEVQPGEIDVAVAKSLSFKTSFNKKTGEYSGAIVGDDTSLTIAATTTKGKVTMNDGNRYGGGTTILSGTVSAGGALSFGTGDVFLYGGTLDLASKAVSNVIFLEGAGVIKGGKKFLGSLAMAADLLKGSQLNIVEGQSATIFSGTVNGTISGEGEVLVTYRPETGYTAPQLGTTGKITTNSLRLMEDSVLLVCDKGLVMNSKASAITIEGGMLSSAGKISAYSLSMEGGKLDVTNAKPMSITLKDAFVATDGADIDLYGGLTANQLTLAGVDFALAMDEADIEPKVQPKAQSITLKGKGVLNTVSNSVLDIAGKVSVTGDLALADSTLSLHDVAGAAKPKAQGLTVKGALAVEDSALSTTGSVSAAALTATGSVISIAAQEGLAAQSLKLTRKDVTKGVPQDNVLTGSALYVNGSMSVAGNLQLQESYLSLRDYSGKNKAMGLSVKGDLTAGSGSVLSLTGALSAKNLTLEADSSLTLASAKLSTVKVGGALTLKGVVNFDLGFTVTEKDVVKGKEYTLFTFKSLVGDVSNLTLGYEGEYTLALNAKGTAITLTVDDAAAWNAYVADIQESLNTAPALASSSAATPEEEVEAEELLLKPVAATADIDPLLAKVADTLVQSTWGTVGASRAFGETIAGRGRNATLLDDGKGAAWLSVMGGSSRISSADGHNGADFTLSGAAFGVEGRVGEKSTLGVAIGNSWGKVSTFSAFPVDQDSMHVGIYGNHTLTKSLTLSWMATHTRTESDANILGAPYSWSQDALQLDARLTWGKSISDKTAVSAFAGLQYLATDSGECAGLKTGSLQNLRVELGVGASHKCSDSTLVFGELSFIGDMVRNNPTAAIGDYRTHGTNPGRVGMNLSVGAAHQLTEDWSLNASYSLELMENSTSHSLNVGASYSF